MKENHQFAKQIEITKESLSNNQKYINENVIQNPISELLKSTLSNPNPSKLTNGSSDALVTTDIKTFQNSYKQTEFLIVSNFHFQYDHKQHTTEAEESLILNNSLQNIQQSFSEIFDELSLIMTGKLPADPSSIDQSEINKKVVQIKIMVDTIADIKTSTKMLFKHFSDQANPMRWDFVIKFGKSFKKHVVNLLKVLITFLEDEQLLMIAIGEDTVSSMQEIAGINKELGELLTKLTLILESLHIGYKTTVHHIYNTLKNMKKELDLLHKVLRRKANMKYRYIYDTNDFVKGNYDDPDEFNQGNTMLYKKIIAFFFPFKNVLNNVHVFSGIISANTKGILEQIET